MTGSAASCQPQEHGTDGTFKIRAKQEQNELELKESNENRDVADYDEQPAKLQLICSPPICSCCNPAAKARSLLLGDALAPWRWSFLMPSCSLTLLCLCSLWVAVLFGGFSIVVCSVSELRTKKANEKRTLVQTPDFAN